MSSPRRVLALLLALVGFVWSVCVLLLALLAAGMRCDEACDGDGWERSTDAWQWDGLLALGVLAFLAGATLLVSVWRGRRDLAAGAYAVGLVATLGFATVFSPGWHEHLGRLDTGEALFFLAGLCAPPAAALLAESRRRPGLRGERSA